MISFLLFITLQRHKALATFFLVVLTIFLGWLAATVNYEEDIAKFLPADPQHQRNTAVYEGLAGNNRIALLFSSIDSIHPVAADSLTAAMDTYADLSASVPVMQGLQPPVDEMAMARLTRFVLEHAPYFLRKTDYVRMDSLLAHSHYVTDRMATNKQMLMLPMPSELQHTLLAYDPLGLFTPVLERLQTFKPETGMQVYNGRLLTADLHHGLLTLTSPYGPSESARNAALCHTLDSIAVLTTQLHPNVNVVAIGAPIIAAGNARQIKTDALWAVSLAVILTLTILFWRFRNIRTLLWIGLPLAFGWLFALAGMRLYTHSVSVIVLGIGSVIIGIAANYPLHFIDHLYETAQRGGTPDVIRLQTLLDMLPPLLIGNITTVAAFLCLVWLDAEAMRHLGVFGSLVLIGTIFFVLVFLPLFAKVPKSVDNPADNSSLKQPRHLRTINLWVMLNKPMGYAQQTIGLCLLTFRAVCRKIFGVRKAWGVCLGLVLTVLLAWGACQTSFDSNLQHINFVTAEQQQGLDLLSHLQPSPTLYIVSEGATTDEALARNDTLFSLLRAKGLDEGMPSLSEFVPTKAGQQQAQWQWHNFLRKHATQLTAALRTEAARQGFSETAFTPFLQRLQKDIEPQPVNFFAPLTSTLFTGRIQTDSTYCRIVTPYYGEKTAHIRQLLHNDKSTAGAFAFSTSDIGNRLVRLLNNSFNYIDFVCGAVVFLFLWLSFGRMELSLLSFLPLAVSWVWILGLMHFTGVQFNIVNIILATFIFGQGDDYTIFMTEGLLYEHAYGRPRLSSYKRSVILSALLMFVGMGTLVVARHPALQSLAHVTLIGMATVVAAAYFLPPLVFRLLTHSNGTLREVPLTLPRFLRSLGSMAFFLCAMFLFMLPFTWFYFHVRRNTEKRKLWFHRFLRGSAEFVTRHMPSVTFRTIHRPGSDTTTQAIWVCNHQSHLDIVSLLSLSDRLVFVTNEWVWKNPFYGYVIRKAEFVPAYNGLEAALPYIRSLWERGYSICIFPEGTRSSDLHITRFHRGACYLAEQLSADLQPVLIHGAGHVLPKTDFMLRRGQITLTLMPRIKASDHTLGHDYRDRTKALNTRYRKWYEQLRDNLETETYWLHYVQHLYLYKGPNVERTARKQLKAVLQGDKASTFPTNRQADVTFTNAGVGARAILFALAHRHLRVAAHIADADDYAVATHLAVQPDNIFWIFDPSCATAPENHFSILR